MSSIITAKGEADVIAAVRGEETPTEVLERGDEAEEPYPARPPAEPQQEEWLDVPEDQRYAHIVTLVTECLQNGNSNNPVLWVFSPVGYGEALTEAWKAVMDEVLPEDVRVNESVHKLYYPEVKEHPDCHRPTNLTFEKKLSMDLEQYMIGVAQFAGVDVVAIHNTINIDLATKKAFYLLMELGTPAIERMLLEKAKTGMANSVLMQNAGRKIVTPPPRRIIQ